jgi:2OG-Fe(II) oxygenase superfamily
MKVKEIIDNKCWTIQEFLSREECQQLIEHGKSEGIEDKQASGDVRHRNNCRILMEDSDLASLMWDRVRDVVPKEFVIGDSSTPPPDGFQNDSVADMEGHWRASGVNNFFTLLYYRSGGHFGPHRDRYVIKSEHERSIMTLTVYLVDRPLNHGGGTNFLRDEMDCPVVDSDGRIRSPEECIEVRVSSDQAGKALLFIHDLMHEGETLEVRREDGSVDEEAQAAPKWLLIAQVLYTRDPSTAPQFTETQMEARVIFKEAEEAEMNGDFALAIKKYNRAYRLDPSLESPFA